MSSSSSSSPISTISLFGDPSSRIVPQYPTLLEHIPEAPPTLWCQGNLSLLNSQCVAIVGTRHPTPRGVQMARYLSRRLTEEGYTLLTSFNEGIDQAACKTFLETGGHVMTVLENRSVLVSHMYLSQKERILSSHGLLVTAYAPRTASEWRRLQSGLALLIIPIQAEEGSGTRNSIRYALNQGRPVWIPYPDRRDAEAHPDKYSGLVPLLPKPGDEPSLLRGFNPLTEMDDLLWQLREERDSWLEQPGHSFVEEGEDPLLAFPESQHQRTLGEVIETFV